MFMGMFMGMIMMVMMCCVYKSAKEQRESGGGSESGRKGSKGIFNSRREVSMGTRHGSKRADGEGMERLEEEEDDELDDRI